jgi:hypothetical protein
MGLFDGEVVAQAGQHILQTRVTGLGIVHVVGRHDRQAQTPGQRHQVIAETVARGRQEQVLQLDEEAVRPEEAAVEVGGLDGGFVLAGSQQLRDLPALAAGEGDQMRSMLLQPCLRQPGVVAIHPGILGGEGAGALGLAQPRRGHQPAQIAVARVVFSQQHQVRRARQVRPDAGLEGKLHADDRPHARLPRRLSEAHRAIQSVVVGQRQRPHPGGGGAADQLLHRRCAIEQGEVGVHMQMCERHGRGRHARETAPQDRGGSPLGNLAVRQRHGLVAAWTALAMGQTRGRLQLPTLGLRLRLEVAPVADLPPDDQRQTQHDADQAVQAVQDVGIDVMQLHVSSSFECLCPGAPHRVGGG